MFGFQVERNSFGKEMIDILKQIHTTTSFKRHKQYFGIFLPIRSAAFPIPFLWDVASI